MSYLSTLFCSECNNTYDPSVVQTFCQDCNKPLLVRYDLEEARGVLDRDEFRSRPSGMWRWHELLPVHEYKNMLYLGEGDTPLLHLQDLGSLLGLSNLFLKDESQNPTGTFKARGLSAAVSKAKELGVTKVIIPTAGNAGGALAAYAARGNLQSFIVMPEDTPVANYEESKICGAEILRVDGLISDAARIADQKARDEGWFDISTFKEPYRTEGKKIMGYELAESFSWDLPDVIIYPTGGGTGLVGMWKAFKEMSVLGWLNSDRRPRMVAVQSDGCAPVVKAFHSGTPGSDFWQDAKTIATGLRVPKSFADEVILRDIKESNGTAVEVSDEAILESQRQLASTQGIFAAPEGAATLAGLNVLLEQGWIKPEDKVVLFNTGSGLKYIC